VARRSIAGAFAGPARRPFSIVPGRILNTKTAKGQVLGTLFAASAWRCLRKPLIDHKFGCIINANIAVSVNADVQDVKVVFVDELDDSNPLSIKGVGEIG